MKSRILLVLIFCTMVLWLWKIVAQEMTYAWIGCDGTMVSRTDVGKLQTFVIEKNLPGCVGPKVLDVTPVFTWSDMNMPSTTESTFINTHTGTQYDATIDGPLFDLSQNDIVQYRIELLKERQIKYANALRSLRMRHAASMQSSTDAYLMRNDAVVASGSVGAWTQVQGASVEVTDPNANTVTPNTDGRADGYIATRLLRDPNPSDLVRIEQADQQFWSDVARVNVAHSVNVRAHPWYGAKILFVLTDATPLYVVSTVDNWSEVISDDRTLHGYIRSDFLKIEKKQRIEVAPLLR